MPKGPYKTASPNGAVMQPERGAIVQYESHWDEFQAATKVLAERW